VDGNSDQAKGAMAAEVVALEIDVEGGWVGDGAEEGGEG